MNDRLLSDLEKARELQSDYERGSEMWNWYQSSIKAMEKEVHARAQDERDAVRTWK